MAETTFRRVNATLTIAAAIAFLLAFAQPVFGGDEPVITTEGGEDFISLSLEDLMKVEITSVSKQKQTVAQAPAAVTAIGQDEIRRSGMNSMPELLRLTPGLNVAQINASHWAISSRGFNELYANKLEVLMDGRSVYTPLFSGVYWDTIDYILPDLDRIEVIRGPGATLWGANAVNGATYGFELAANWNVTPAWRLTGSYSFLMTELHRGFGVDPTLERLFEGTSPRNQFQIHSYYDITKNLELNAGLYYVENLRTGDIPSYIRIDAGATWRPTSNVEVTVGVQNLLDPQHPEFNSGLFFNQTTEVPRVVYA
jgi:outer membrane receptor protein involved in Fe transport